VGREPFCVGHGLEISEAACMRGVLGGKFCFGYKQKTARTHTSLRTSKPA